jgi:hypothetical protein
VCDLEGAFLLTDCGDHAHVMAEPIKSTLCEPDREIGHPSGAAVMRSKRANTYQGLRSNPISTDGRTDGEISFDHPEQGPRYRGTDPYRFPR